MTVDFDVDSVTEQENPFTRDLDSLPIAALLDALNTEDHLSAIAVRRVLPKVERIVDQAVSRLASGGRMLYVAAGTSGRIAYMDAAECPPTFGIPPDTIAVCMAGGREAVFRARESGEDGARAAEADVAAWAPTPKDCVIGLAASGKTPYVLAGLAKAKAAGAFTALVCANDAPPDLADVVVCCITGPEALTGSTRLKAGTAEKMILNMISTASMVKLGKTYGNRMSHIRASNRKLSRRCVQTLVACCGMDDARAVATLEEAGGSLAVALVMGLRGVGAAEAQRALLASGGAVRGTSGCPRDGSGPCPTT